MNSTLVKQLTDYFSTNGSLAEVVAFANLVATNAWSDIAHLAKIMGL